MQKLLILILIIGVIALFSGCIKQPTAEEKAEEKPPVAEEITPTETTEEQQTLEDLNTGLEEIEDYTAEETTLEDTNLESLLDVLE